jgi:hypothetical protein
MSKTANHKMIRVPAELAERIERIQAELLAAYEAGLTSRVELTDQGTRGAWISKSEVIRLALDEMEDHKARSRKSRSNARSIQGVSTDIATA